MTLPNFTRIVLDALDTQANGGAWDTGLAPAPIRYNRMDGTRLDTGARVEGVDLAEGVVASVGVTGQDNEPIGTEYDHRSVSRLSVRLEGVHTDERGTIDGHGDWVAATNAARNALTADRVYPVDGNPLTVALRVPDETDRSPTNRDYFRRDYTVTVRTYDALP